MLARALPDLEVNTIRVLGGGRDIRYQALDAEDRLYDVRRWDSPWLVDIDDWIHATEAAACRPKVQRNSYQMRCLAAPATAK
jgi:hypothetical protein